jgi:hypothetical protein
MDTKIAIQKPYATITNKARTFRLEMFRTALVNTPNYFTLQDISRKKTTQKRVLRENKATSVAALA